MNIQSKLEPLQPPTAETNLVLAKANTFIRKKSTLSFLQARKTKASGKTFIAIVSVD